MAGNAERWDEFQSRLGQNIGQWLERPIEETTLGLIKKIRDMSDWRKKHRIRKKIEENSVYRRKYKIEEN